MNTIQHLSNEIVTNPCQKVLQFDWMV